MAAKLLAPRWFARAIKGGNEENVLCQVDASCHRLVHGLLLSPFGSSRCIASISWRIDAVEGRGRRPSHRAPARPRVQHPCATPTLSSSWCSTFPGTTFPEVTSPGATSPPHRPRKDEHQLVHGVQHPCATPTLSSSWCSTFPEVTSPRATSPPQRPGKDEHQLVHGVQHPCATPTLSSS